MPVKQEALLKAHAIMSVINAALEVPMDRDRHDLVLAAIATEIDGWQPPVSGNHILLAQRIVDLIDQINGHTHADHYDAANEAITRYLARELQPLPVQHAVAHSANATHKNLYWLPEHAEHDVMNDEPCPPDCPRRKFIETSIIGNENWEPVVPPPVPAAPPWPPAHEHADGERYCGRDCPRGKWVGQLLEHDEALVPFLNAARNKLDKVQKTVLPGEVWNSETALSAPRWHLAALYGYLTSRSTFEHRPSWLHSIIGDLELLIQR